MATAAALKRAERQTRVLAMRKDHGLSLRQIAAREGCGHETIRRDLNKYLSRLDSACLEGAAALRGEIFEKYDAIVQTLEFDVLVNGNLDRVPDLLKTTAEIRRLYALDIQPMTRTELALRRTVITEITTKLKDRLPVESFAEIALALTDDEPIQLIDGIAVEDSDEAGIDPPQRRTAGPGPAPGAAAEAFGHQPLHDDPVAAPRVVDAEARG